MSSSSQQDQEQQAFVAAFLALLYQSASQPSQPQTETAEHQLRQVIDEPGQIPPGGERTDDSLTQSSQPNSIQDLVLFTPSMASYRSHDQSTTAAVPETPLERDSDAIEQPSEPTVVAANRKHLLSRREKRDNMLQRAAERPDDAQLQNRAQIEKQRRENSKAKAKAKRAKRSRERKAGKGATTNLKAEADKQVDDGDSKGEEDSNDEFR